MSPSNIAVPLFEDGDHVTGQVTAAVTGKRFLKISGNFLSGPDISDAVDGGNMQVQQCGLGEDAIGVSEWDQPTVGGLVGVIGEPGMYVPVESGAAIAANADVQSDALGRAITYVPPVAPAEGAALPTKRPLGKCVSGVGAAGLETFIKLRV